MISKYKPIVCALKIYNLNSREKFEPGGPGSNHGPGKNFSLEFKELILKNNISRYTIFESKTDGLDSKHEQRMT